MVGRSGGGGGELRHASPIMGVAVLALFRILFLVFSNVCQLLVDFAMRYAILVCGPAGAGKSTFCTALQTHMQTVKRTAHLFNLDPAADPGSFEYEPAIDIRDLIK